jgi:hypothetical protein
MCIGKLILSEFHIRELLLEGNYRIDKREPLAALLVEYNNIMNIYFRCSVLLFTALRS